MFETLPPHVGHLMSAIVFSHIEHAEQVICIGFATYYNVHYLIQSSQGGTGFLSAHRPSRRIFALNSAAS
jgi:hypothetical protein